jgi:hypothetical protein
VESTKFRAYSELIGLRKTLSVHTLRVQFVIYFIVPISYEGVSISSRTGSLELELQMVQLSATWCSCIAIL